MFMEAVTLKSFSFLQSKALIRTTKIKNNFSRGSVACTVGAVPAPPTLDFAPQTLIVPQQLLRGLTDDQ